MAESELEGLIVRDRRADGWWFGFGTDGSELPCTTFTALIARILPDPLSMEVIADAMPAGTLNYLPRRGQYPDDLDDSALGMLALLEEAPFLITAPMVAGFLGALQAGGPPGGPYRTWLSDAAPAAPDGAVNANILRSLALLRSRPEPLERFVAAWSRCPHSPYYFEGLPAYFAVSAGFRAPVRAGIAGAASQLISHPSSAVAYEQRRRLRAAPTFVGRRSRMC